MSRRLRKKQLKKLGKYVSSRECWNLDATIAEFIIPRLKKYKQETIGYPCLDRELYTKTNEQKSITFEDWKNILDEMILAFELSLTDPFDELERLNLDIKNKTDYDIFMNICEERNRKIERGLDLFKYYYQDLWW